ncbi:unnamed protein product [Peniophora sp. CBMAI 1063]|nr:unnamed protein product [Peniophora sp. CBMAI 1063]
MTSGPVMEPASSPPERADPRSSIGPYIIGCSFNWLLMGTLLVQLYAYDKERKRLGDSRWLRSLVVFVTCMDIAQTVVTTRDLWHFAIDSWGDYDALSQLTWGEALISPFAGCAALAVQLFYAWILRAFACVIIMLSLMQFIASLHGTVFSLIKYVKHDNLSYLSTRTANIDIYVWLCGSFTGDIVISSCMVWLLHRAKSQTIWPQSQTLYDRLIIHSVQTGLVSTTAAGLVLVLWKINNRYYVAAGIIIGKLYSNSLLSTLNGRASRRQHMVHDSAKAFDRHNERGSLSQLRTPHIQPSLENSGDPEARTLRDLGHIGDGAHTTRSSAVCPNIDEDLDGVCKVIPAINDIRHMASAEHVIELASLARSDPHAQSSIYDKSFAV